MSEAQHRFTYRPGTFAAICANDRLLIIDIAIDDPLVIDLFNALINEDDVEQAISNNSGRPSPYALITATDSVVSIVKQGNLPIFNGGEPLDIDPETQRIELDAESPWSVGRSNEMVELPIGFGVFLADEIRAANPASAQSPVLIPNPAVEVSKPGPVLIDSFDWNAPVVSKPETIPAPVWEAPFSFSQENERADYDRFRDFFDEKPATEPESKSALEPAEPTPESGSTPTPESPVIDHEQFFDPTPEPIQMIDYAKLSQESADLNTPANLQPEPQAIDGVDSVFERTVNHNLIPQPNVPTITAVQCVTGHLSPPYATACRVCRGPIPPQQPFTAPRPMMGVLRFPNGAVLNLENSVVMGRRPHLPAEPRDDSPQLIPLHDPEKDVSSQHIEIRLDYWHVLAIDLGSTNGTWVTLPGQEPVQLRPNEPLIIEPGTIIDLAQALPIQFEAI